MPDLPAEAAPRRLPPSRLASRLALILSLGASVILVAFATMARAPQIAVRWQWAAALTVVMLTAMIGCGLVLWRATRFA